MRAIVVFAHLRWHSARQRPRQLLTRLAKWWRIVYVEEPVPNAAHSGLDVIDAAPGVQVWRAHVTGDAAGFHDDHLPALREIIATGLRERDVGDFWAWFYTPLAVPLASCLAPRGVVYDCIDELAHLQGAPRQLLQRENALFKRADLVFTAGRSLHNAKRLRHPDVHCFPGGADAAGASWDSTASAIAELLAQADDVAESGAAFMKPQPTDDGREPVPLYLANAAQTLAVVAPADPDPRRAATG